jgi:pyrimidine-specific ribonucleoside hydrolase
MMKRRDLLLASAAAVAELSGTVKAKSGWTDERPKKSSIPLVHITDLYHPPQDPDDHIDLATVAALHEYDLKGVILDTTRKFLLASPAGFDIQRDPGFIPVIQLGYLLGRSIPVATGPTLPLTRPDDDVSDRPPWEQAGVTLLLNILEDSREEVVVSVVGSARVLTAAYNRSPELVRTRVRSVLLNAGSTGGLKREWNVDLDPEAYVGLWRSGLPIHWYPCATETGAFNPNHERGTYWKTTHAEIFRDLAPSLRSWFTYAFSPGNGGDIIAALTGTGPPGSWERILAEQRNMWATASLVMGAGRVLAKTPQGWRFVPSSSADAGKIWPWHLDRIEAMVNTKAEVQWRLLESGGNAFLFQRRRGTEFGSAMAEALGALLGSLTPLEK